VTSLPAGRAPRTSSIWQTQWCGPEVGPGQLCINFADIRRRAGIYPAQLPFVQGQKAVVTS
jgi:hypothetical protein